MCAAMWVSQRTCFLSSECDWGLEKLSQTKKRRLDEMFSNN